MVRNADPPHTIGGQDLLLSAAKIMQTSNNLFILHNFV
jgi:hypothetical protein